MGNVKEKKKNEINPKNLEEKDLFVNDDFEFDDVNPASYILNGELTYGFFDKELIGFLKIANQIGNAICLLDSEGRVVLYNKNFAAILKCEKEQFLGQSLEIISDISPITLAKEVYSAYLSIQHLPKIFVTDQYQTASEKQSYCISFNFLNPSKKEDDRILLTINQLFIGDSFLGNNQELENIKAKEIVNEQNRFINYLTAHELQSPLRIIEAFSRHLLEDGENELNLESERILKIIRNKSLEGKKLVRDLLQMARIENVPMQFQEVNLNEIVQSVVADFDTAVGEFQFIIQEDLPIVNGIPSLISQLFCNLFSNAIKFSKTRAKTIIKLGVFEREKEYEFYLEDNGTGIESEYIDKIFDPFFRIGGIKGSEGNGLGLSMVKKSIDCHGGKIWVVSEFELFTRFHFTLPKNLY